MGGDRLIGVRHRSHTTLEIHRFVALPVADAIAARARAHLMDADRVAVVDRHRVGRRHEVPGRAHALAEVEVLAGGEPEVLVEPTDGFECLATHDGVRRDESPAILAGLMLDVHLIGDHPADGIGVEQRTDGTAERVHLGVLAEVGAQIGQPVGVDDDVVVDEDDHVGVGRSPAEVPCRRGPGLRLRHDAHRMVEFVEERVVGGILAIEHHEDVERIAWQEMTMDRVECLEE